MEMTIVGRPYRGVAKRRDEGPYYTLAYGRHELAIFLDRPTTEEVTAFHEGAVTFGYWWDPPVLWALFRIDGMAWSDAPYTIHKVDPDGRAVPPPDNGLSPAVTMLMCEAADGLVRGIRIASMSQTIAAGIHSAARNQLATPYDAVEYEKAVQRRYAETGDSEAMTKHADRMGRLGVQPASEWPHRN